MSRVIRGANAEVVRSTAPEIVVSGPSGSGKTFAMLYKINRYCLENPRVRVLFLRGTRESMNESTLETWESEIYPKKLLARSNITRGSRRSYSYPNKSRIILGGMDKADKFLGTRFDIIYVNECTEFTEKEWQTAASRLQSTRGPYRQMLGDCNPADIGKEHWLWKRYERGDCEFKFADHSLNPAMTPDALERLSKLTGEERRRFFEGSWDALPKGEVFKAEWFTYINEFPHCEKWIRYWDIASGDSDAADYTVGVLMGRMADGRHVIGDVVRFRKSPNDRNNHMLMVAQQDAQIEALQFFEKAHGIGVDMVSSITSFFEDAGYSIWGIKPKGSKRFRADPLAQKFQAGRCCIVRKGLMEDLKATNVGLDSRKEHAWIAPFKLELCNFTGDEVKDKGKKDDQVDGASGANILLARGV